MTGHGETFHDELLHFTLPERDAHGRCVRLDCVVDEILRAHDYPEPIKHLLAEALVLAALMGSLQKEDGAQLTMQAQTPSGPVRLLVADFRAGELRGYVEFDGAGLHNVGANASLERLFRNGYLAITFETEKRRRYQGIVPLEGASLADACQQYFHRSEQLPTLLAVGISLRRANCLAGGMLVQHLAHGEVGNERLHTQIDYPDWEHLEALAGSLGHRELVDPKLSMEALVWRLFHKEAKILVEKGNLLAKGCRCSVDHYNSIIARFPEAERAMMRDELGRIVIDCAFCSKGFLLKP